MQVAPRCPSGTALLVGRDAAVALAYPISMGRDAGVSVRVVSMRYLERPRG